MFIVAVFGILFLLVLLQSTLVHYIAILEVKPDFPLLAVLFFANRWGRFFGQTGGIWTGILEDLVSLSPLGLNGLVNTVVGFVFGFSSGKIFVDPILLPMLIAAVATILKVLLLSFLSALFSIQPGAATFFSVRFLIEIAYNMVSAPVLFAILGWSAKLWPRQWRGGAT